MEHVINVSEVQHPKPASIHQGESLTQNKIESPVVSQLSHEYSLLPLSNSEVRLPPLKQEMQALPVDVRKFANPAPLGLCAFALTSFLSNCINLNVGNIQASGVSVSLALNYGGITQVLAGMWYVLRDLILYLLLERMLLFLYYLLLTISGKWPWEIHSVLRLSPLLVPIGSLSL